MLLPGQSLCQSFTIGTKLGDVGLWIISICKFIGTTILCEGLF